MSKRITTHLVYPPIPVRNYDWMACFGDYEPGNLVGYGATEDAAIADLMEQRIFEAHEEADAMGLSNDPTASTHLAGLTIQRGRERGGG